MAAATSVVDVAMNTQGIEVERRSGRPVMSRLHASHSLGVLAGGLGGTLAAGSPVAAHFAAAATVILVLGQFAASGLVAEPARPGPLLAWPRGPLLGLGALAFCAFLIERAAGNWSAVHLRGAHDASPTLAAGAFTAFALARAAGRMVGDRYSRAPSGACLIAAAGIGLAIAAPTAALAVAGWAVLGAGISIVAPSVMRAAGATPGTPAPVGIAAVSTVGYLGSFTAPPLIGALAQPVGLSAALLVVLFAALVAAALAQATVASSGISASIWPRPGRAR
jgi:hypothetical protein